MYHPHADETTQMAMGMMGFWVTHSKEPGFMPVDRDYVLLLNAYDIDPGSYTPRVSTMLDFNVADFQQPRIPGHRSRWWPASARGGVCAFGSATSPWTNHPIHLHGQRTMLRHRRRLTLPLLPLARGDHDTAAC